MTLKFKRVSNEEYQSTCNRVIIKKQVSQQTRRADETVWEFSIDGNWHHFGYDTKRDATNAAEKKLAEADAKKVIDRLFTAEEKTTLLTVLNNVKAYDPDTEIIDKIIAKVQKCDPKV